MFTIDVDTGGTFTDGFFTHNGKFQTVKVLTTPHDLTVCLADCIREGAQQFGLSVKDMLANTDVVRYSSTIGVNTLITRTGSKVGLIITKGFKNSIYARDPREAKPISDFISQEMITEVEENINDQGDIIRPLDKNEVLARMQYLIDMGARAIAVSLKNSHLDPTHERQIKRIIKEQYPSFYLGSVRVFLASEVSDQPGDFYRTNAVVINGYIHDSLVKYLYKAEDDLRVDLYQHPLMVSHSHGGVTRVAKTRAIDTFSSGPALGLIGAERIGETYGLKDVLTVDMGGTSLDLGLMRDGACPYSFNPSISGLPVNITMIDTYSVPLAGGSIANLDSSKNLQIGPQSAGSRPGPACFDLGGLEPTVTDADVALGYIDPDYFLGGKVRLNQERAISAIKIKIADPLGISVEEASYKIKETADRRIQNELLQFLKRQGLEAINQLDIALIVYGGAGPTHCCGFSQGLGFSQSLTSPYSSVFSAFGSSTTDLLHSYPKFVRITLFDGSNYLTDYDQFNQIVNESIVLARRDIHGEGFLPDNAIYSLDLVGDGELNGMRVTINNLYLRSQSDIEMICKEFSDAGKLEIHEVALSTIILNAVVQMPHFDLKTEQLAPRDPNKAIKTERNIFWSPEVGYRKTPVYERGLLVPGNLIVGPAVVEAKDTTYVIPADQSFYIDEYSNAIIKEV